MLIGRLMALRVAAVWQRAQRVAVWAARLAARRTAAWLLRAERLAERSRAASEATGLRPGGDVPASGQLAGGDVSSLTLPPRRQHPARRSFRGDDDGTD